MQQTSYLPFTSCEPIRLVAVAIICIRPDRISVQVRSIQVGVLTLLSLALDPLPIFAPRLIRMQSFNFGSYLLLTLGRSSVCLSVPPSISTGLVIVVSDT